MFEVEREIFPDFPRTEHLPAFEKYAPNATSDDKIAPKVSLQVFSNPNVFYEEKIDAANSGICHYPELNDGQPLIRNRNYILRKGYSRKNTPAKLQFTPIWNWYYENVGKFETLNDILGFNAPVYGEWMYQQSSIFYDKLPSLFIAYDVWDWRNKCFIRTDIVRKALVDSGFTVPPLLLTGPVSPSQVFSLLDQVSPWAADESSQVHAGNHKIEGVYIKVVDDSKITARYKMVRPGFNPGAAFSDKITKNVIVR